MLLAQGLLFVSYLLPAMATSITATRPPPPQVTIKNDHPLIYYHGRWDASPGTWW